MLMARRHLAVVRQNTARPVYPSPPTLPPPQSSPCLHLQTISSPPPPPSGVFPPRCRPARHAGEGGKALPRERATQQLSVSAILVRSERLDKPLSSPAHCTSRRPTPTAGNMSSSLWSLAVVLVVSAGSGALARPGQSLLGSIGWDELALQARAPETLTEVASWPDPGISLGQVSGVATDTNADVMVFHRGDRVWGPNSFSPLTNKFLEEDKGPITANTILRLDPHTGKVKSGLGSNLFYLPHGLTVDSRSALWVTDVALHQVMRIPAGASAPDLVLGTRFQPGNDHAHFCKPTDVAVASDGQFFVADGYCNSRLLKFSSNGTLLAEWGSVDTGLGFTRPLFRVPHSLALDESRDTLYVADREHARVCCFRAGLTDPATTGVELPDLVPYNEIGRVYGIEYDPIGDVVQMVVDPRDQIRGYTYRMTQKGGIRVGRWGHVSPNMNSLPHDVTVSPNGLDVYLAEIGTVPKKLVKFSAPHKNRAM